MNRLANIVNKKERLVIGLNSGTSVDGVDAICARIRGGGFELQLIGIWFFTIRLRIAL